MTQTKDSTTGEPSHREKLLAKALGDVLVAAGVMREASATGPELLHMAESYVLSAPSRMAASSEGEGQPIRYHLTEPTVEINGRMLGEGWLLITEAEYAALTALAVPDKGVQGDQGSSGGLGQPGSGSQPGANVGATAALAWEDAPLRQMLWAVTGPGCFPNVFACHLNTIRNGDDARYIWGFSVHKGKPGFRTLGQNKAWADENSLLLFSTVGAAFAHITAYFAGAKDIRP
jgi:hypothetical protein